MEGDKEQATLGVPILIKSGSIDCATHQWSQLDISPKERVERSLLNYPSSVTFGRK
jgi:hypothetical protein